MEADTSTVLRLITRSWLPRFQSWRQRGLDAINSREGLSLHVGFDVRLLSSCKISGDEARPVAAERRLSRPPIDAALNLHGSVVALEGRGLLIVGASGAGKSALALRLMALGATLVADDRVVVARRGDALVASAPPELSGLIEARGVGLLRARALEAAALELAVDLDRSDAARMPHLREITYFGIDIRLIFAKGLPNLEAILVQMLRCESAG